MIIIRNHKEEYRYIFEASIDSILGRLVRLDLGFRTYMALGPCPQKVNIRL